MGGQRLSRGWHALVQVTQGWPRGCTGAVLPRCRLDEWMGTCSTACAALAPLLDLILSLCPDSAASSAFPMTCCSDNIDDYVVHDPLLEAGKAKFNKQQQRAKKRQSEWAGRAQG